MRRDEAELQHQTEQLKQRAALAETRLMAAEAEVYTLRLRHERMLALLSEAERGRRSAQHSLVEHRDSLSWRLTAPLRRVKRSARLRHGRR